MSQEQDHPWRDEEKLREMYVEKEMSLRQISDEWGCSHHTVSRWVEKFDFDKRDRRGYYEKPPYRDEDLLRKLYITKGETTYEIADRFDCTAPTISYWLEEYGIERRMDTHPDDTPWRDESTLRRLYWDEEMESHEVADELGCTVACVWKWLVHHGIERRLPGACRPGSESPVWNENRETIRYAPNWDDKREKVLERDGYTCAIPSCDVTNEKQIEDIGFGLNVHHIVPLREFKDDDGTINYEKSDTMDNLVSLCHTHHGMYEGVPIDLRNDAGGLENSNQSMSKEVSE